MATPRLAESGSRRLPDSPSFSFIHSKADSPARRVGEDPISAKTPENPPHCHVPLNYARALMVSSTSEKFFFVLIAVRQHDFARQMLHLNTLS
jgi:hypothetical protein